MPVSIEALLVFAAFVCAVFVLNGKVNAGVPILLLCVVELLRLVGR